MEKQDKLDLIQAARGPLEHEEYAAEVDVELAGTSEDPALLEGPQSRLNEVRAKLGVLKDKEKAVQAEG